MTSGDFFGNFAQFFIMIALGASGLKTAFHIGWFGFYSDGIGCATPFNAIDRIYPHVMDTSIDVAHPTLQFDTTLWHGKFAVVVIKCERQLIGIAWFVIGNRYIHQTWHDGVVERFVVGC